MSYDLSSAAWCRRFNFEALMQHIGEMTPDRLGEFIKSCAINDPFIPLLVSIKGVVDFMSNGGYGEATEAEGEDGEAHFFVDDCLRLVACPILDDLASAYHRSEAKLFEKGISFAEWRYMSTLEQIEALESGCDFRDACGNHRRHVHLGRLVAGLGNWVACSSNRHSNFTLSIPEPAATAPREHANQDTPLNELRKPWLLGNEGATSAAE